MYNSVSYFSHSLFVSPRVALGFKTTTIESQRVGRGSNSYRTLRKESRLFSLSEEPIVLLRMDGNSGRGYWMRLGIISSGIHSGRFINKDVQSETRTSIYLLLYKFPSNREINYIFYELGMYKFVIY